MKKFLSLLAILGLCASPLGAAGPRWVPLGPPGGTVVSLAADPSLPRTLYAVGSTTGVFKSVNGGISWTFLEGSPRGGIVAVDPTRPSTLYAASEGCPPVLAKSTDGGATPRRPRRNQRRRSVPL